MASNGDWYVEAVDGVERAALALHESLDQTVGALRDARDSRLAGAGLIDIVNELVQRGGRDLRLAPTAAFRAYEQAMTAYRGAAVRALVDEEHMSLSAVAELIGVSRQMVARLYRNRPT
jgi:hypothetical protein